MSAQDRAARAIALLYLLVIVALLAFLAGRITAQPSCPTKDSCRADYRSGRWYIEQVTP